MARPATGQILERQGVEGTTYALRVRAYGKREYLTLGSDSDGWNRPRAEITLAATLKDIREGVWQPPTRGASKPIRRVPGDPAGEAYGLVRRALQALDSGRTKFTTAIARGAVDEATSALYATEDALGRAMREAHRGRTA